MAKEDRVNLTPARIECFSCKQGQAFLWDADTPGLGVRATPTRKSYIVQERLGRQSVRITIDHVGAITLKDARTEAKRLLLLFAQGIDPREQKRQQVEAEAAARKEREVRAAKESAADLPVGVLWEEYVEDRRPHWGERSLRDHMVLTRKGGQPLRRGSGVQTEGPLHPLLKLKVRDLTPARIEKWLGGQVALRPTQAALAMRLLRAFLNWCAEHERYRAVIPEGLLTRRIIAAVPKASAKNDYLQREQLSLWFQEVRKISNPVIRAYLQCLLLLGCRREELANLRWADVDFRWGSLTIGDKIEESRTIPLPGYCAHLLEHLQKRNRWVFSSPAAASGRLINPTKQHHQACERAGLERVSLHGLRRSFGSLSEWCELPVGVVAQIQGHRPSALAEKHYRRRPLDLLRQWHQKYEDWILEQAGIEVPERQEPGEVLRLVAGGGR